MSTPLEVFETNEPSAPNYAAEAETLKELYLKATTTFLGEEVREQESTNFDNYFFEGTEEEIAKDIKQVDIEGDRNELRHIVAANRILSMSGDVPPEILQIVPGFYTTLTIEDLKKAVDRIEPRTWSLEDL